MAKGDHERGERRIDEQMKQSQSYLTMLQNQLGNQYSGLSNIYSGGWPQTGNIYGWGTTVPNYSPYGPIFSGNDTDRPVFGIGPTSYNTSVPRQAGSSSTQMANEIRAYLESQGAPSSEIMERSLPELQRRYPGLQRDNSSGPLDEYVLPDGTIIDFLANAETGGPRSWTAQIGSPGTGGGYGGYSSGFGVGPSGVGGIIGRNLGDYGNIMGRFAGFADTGGLSEADKANIRSRAVSPIRSIYSSARQGLDRQRALQGGYSPGFSTGMARLSREQGQLASDATTNAEAAIAEMVQRGKLAGMGGMASMYGATPGLSNMFGNQALQAMQQQLGAAGLQNQLSMGIMNNQLGLAAVPGNVDSFFNTIGGVGRAAGQVGGAIYPWLN